MFTLFWGGEVFAPRRLHAGENVGVFLRRAYTSAMVEACRRLKGLIIGVDLINEPHPGFIGLPNLLAFDPNSNLHLGSMPSPLQSMIIADGFAIKVPVYEKTWVVGNGAPTWPLSFAPTAPRKGDVPRVNASMTRAWADGAEDVWRQHDVWRIDEDGSISCNHPYFSVFPPGHSRSAQNVDFISGCLDPPLNLHVAAWGSRAFADFYDPFISAFSRRLREIDSDIFLAGSCVRECVSA